MPQLIGTGQFAGILGWPLEETLSPAIHNAAFRALQIDCAYFVWPVAPDSLGDAVAGLRALQAFGANVTIPHKEKVIEHLDQLSEDAAEIGAVNTIQRVGKRLIGHNTDVEGFREFVAGDAGIDLADKHVVVLGAGGAARAVVRAASELGAAPITVVARDEGRAQGLSELAENVVIRAWDDRSAAAEAADAVVNATPIGADGEDPLPEQPWRPGQTAIDLLYLPPATPFMARARRAGADSWGGLGMLVRQAAASFRIWTGQDPPLGAMSAAAVHAIGISGSTRPPALPT